MQLGINYTANGFLSDCNTAFGRNRVQQSQEEPSAKVSLEENDLESDDGRVLCHSSDQWWKVSIMFSASIALSGICFTELIAKQYLAIGRASNCKSVFLGSQLPLEASYFASERHHMIYDRNLRLHEHRPKHHRCYFTTIKRRMRAKDEIFPSQVCNATKPFAKGGPAIASVLDNRCCSLELGRHRELASGFQSKGLETQGEAGNPTSPSVLLSCFQNLLEDRSYRRCCTLSFRNDFCRLTAD